MGIVGVLYTFTPWLAPWEIDPNLPLDRGGVDLFEIILRLPTRVKFNPLIFVTMYMLPNGTWTDKISDVQEWDRD